ncbi:MAG: hypothetical protein F8N37_11200 [Telmatospirillum sp.]|nr:hypothetical protein [Telmatospirillum sp.]
MHSIVRSIVIALPLAVLSAGSASAFSIVGDDDAKSADGQRLTGDTNRTETSADGSTRTMRLGNGTSLTYGMQRRAGFAWGAPSSGLQTDRDMTSPYAPSNPASGR